MSHTKIPTTDSSEDSDSSLPDLSPFLLKVVTPISSGDIVFAKFRGLYWPALVKTVYSNQKKISICYCDEPSKTFKLPMKNVCSFFDREMRSKIEDDIRKAGFFAAFEGLCSHALRYLKRRINGHNDDPKKFFDQTYPFYLVEKLLQENPNADVDNLKIPPLYIRNEGKADIKKTTRVSKEKTHGSEISSTDSTEMSETESEDDVKPKIVGFWKTPNSSTTKYVDIIIKHILSGKADVYLKTILSRSIPSEFFNIYERAILDGKIDVESMSFTGPVEDSNRVNEIITYLFSFLDNADIVHNAPRLKTKILNKTFRNFRLKDKANLIASVMLPEAIICAIAEIHNVSLSEAKQLFHQNPKSCPKVIENIISTSNVSCEETNIVANESSLKETHERNTITTKKRNIEKVDLTLKKGHDVKSTRNTKKSKKNLISEKNIEAISCSECKAVLPKTIPKKRKKKSKCKSVSDICETC